MDALAMTEPGAGSDVRGMKTFAKEDGGDFVVNGMKHFISHADLADFVICFIATGEEQTAKGPKKKITCFLVDRGMPGFEIRKGYNSVSHRGYHNCILTFDNCRLPKSQVLGELHGGFEVMNPGSTPPASPSPPPASAAPSGPMSSPRGMPPTAASSASASASSRASRSSSPT